MPASPDRSACEPRRRRLRLLLPLLLLPAGAALGQTPPVAAEPMRRTVDARPAAVTLYAGRAAVTRECTLQLEQGLHELRFANLPHTVMGGTLQARAGGGARLVDIEFVETPQPDPAGSPKAKELDAAILSIRRAVEYQGQDLAQLAASIKLLDAVTVPAAAPSVGEKAQATALDLASLEKQLAFVASERRSLIARERELTQKRQVAERELAALEARRKALGGGGSVERSAVLRVAMPSAGEVPLSLTYLVTDAGWQPAYAVRTSADRASVTLDFDATVQQRSGEDWNDVRMSLSTAQPTIAANPPAVQPVFVQLLRPQPPVSGGLASVSEGRAARDGDDRSGLADAAEPSSPRFRSTFARAAADAEVASAGTAVNFDLPRRVTVPTDSDRSTRTRVASIQPQATFVYAAQPLLTDAVYLRGTLVNASPYQLVPGPAQVFMGEDYVGPTRLGSVAPQGQFDLFFGVDRALRATRETVKRTAGDRGLFSGSREDLREERITIDNGTGRAIRVEVLDRRPVSRDERIKVAVEELSAPLSANPEYVAGPFTQGILRWDLQVPAEARGPSAATLSWKVRTTWPKDVEPTGMPR